MSRADSQAEVSDLGELRILLEALRLALARQRDAIAALDLDELAQASAEQRRLADEIALIQQTMSSGNHEAHELRQTVTRLATRVRATAVANQALLADAQHMIGHVLGTETEPSGYDRRARRASEPRRSFAKAV